MTIVVSVLPAFAAEMFTTTWKNAHVAPSMPPLVVLRPVNRPSAMCVGAVGLPHQSGKLKVAVSVVPSAKRSV